MTLALYPQGATVLLGSPDAPHTDRPKATILACDLSGPEYSTVKYLCSWWNDGDMKREWIDAIMIEPLDAAGPVMRLEWANLRINEQVGGS